MCRALKFRIFEDVAVYFTEQELASLTLDQKALFQDVVLENFAHWLRDLPPKPPLGTVPKATGEVQ
ncbi:hypothetical protein A6R68_02247 [Neotoma lepida]|uniref:KRAB domain-containing protein n=1 Tax=Neotoma lepida TaxID=56216 RepID=A0A1A6GU84_NEOLE|nr:hypothetical protein A6R68_02247 [Neotoma lepida]